jgi:D-lyxose ketol-isomerase
MPYEQAFRFVGQSSEETAWMNVELEPGNYVAVCVIPDTEGSDFAAGEIITHLEHGMIALFTVSE